MISYPLPANFDGAAFAKRYNLRSQPGASDFYISGGRIYVPDTLPVPPIFDIANSNFGRDAEIAQNIIQALALATHQRFKASVPADTMTLAQWKATLLQAYDTVKV